MQRLVHTAQSMMNVENMEIAERISRIRVLMNETYNSVWQIGLHDLVIAPTELRH